MVGYNNFLVRPIVSSIAFTTVGINGFSSKLCVKNNVVGRNVIQQSSSSNQQLSSLLSLSQRRSVTTITAPTTTTSLKVSSSASSSKESSSSISSSTSASSTSSSSAASSPAVSYSIHTSFDDTIIDKYDAFILDQFGVLHNGINALDGAVELVEHLYSKGKRLIILSNTSAPSSKALEKLPKFGFNRHHFEDAVTSGEESSKYIREVYGSSSTSEATSSDTKNVKKALMFTWDACIVNNPRLTVMPEVYLEQCGTNIEVATSVENADFVLFHGSEIWYKGTCDTTSASEDSDDTVVDLSTVSLHPFIETGTFDDTNVIDTILKECISRDLPGICANPDYIVQTPDGDGVAYMPGKLASRYQDLGGKCTIFGKPNVKHFHACLHKLGFDILDDQERVAHVGDSLHHDIVGAVNAGIPNIFVTSGIHKHDLNVKEFGILPHPETLEQVIKKEVGNESDSADVDGDDKSVRPTHVVPAFRL